MVFACETIFSVYITQTCRIAHPMKSILVVTDYNAIRISESAFYRPKPISQLSMTISYLSLHFATHTRENV